MSVFSTASTPENRKGVELQLGRQRFHDTLKNPIAFLSFLITFQPSNIKFLTSFLVVYPAPFVFGGNWGKETQKQLTTTSEVRLMASVVVVVVVVLTDVSLHVSFSCSLAMLVKSVKSKTGQFQQRKKKKIKHP